MTRIYGGTGWGEGRELVLNLTCRDALSAVALGSSLVWMDMPWLRAVGGRYDRNSRADLDFVEKGLILVFTSVMNRVIIFAGRWCVWLRERCKEREALKSVDTTSRQWLLKLSIGI